MVRRRTWLIVGLVVIAACAALILLLSSGTLSVQDQGALSFGASANATNVAQNQTISVTVSDKNSLYLTNVVPLSADWKVPNLSMGSCSFYEYNPYGIAVYQGRYTLDNLSSAQQLVIYAPGIYFCGALTSASTFKFDPHQNVSNTAALRGYYTTEPNLLSFGGPTPVLHPFLPGEYTIVAGDEWGNVRLLYFQVSGIALQSFSLCPSNCVYPSPYLAGEIYIGGPSPLTSLQLFVNGTDEGIHPYTGITDVIYMYQASFQSPAVATGDAYTLKFIATFQDGSTSMASTSVMASG